MELNIKNSGESEIAARFRKLYKENKPFFVEGELDNVSILVFNYGDDREMLIWRCGESEQDEQSETSFEIVGLYEAESSVGIDRLKAHFEKEFGLCGSQMRH